jgi:hypothetical protein
MFEEVLGEADLPIAGKFVKPKNEDGFTTTQDGVFDCGRGKVSVVPNESPKSTVTAFGISLRTRLELR